MMRIIFLKLFLIREKKNTQITWHLLYKQSLYNCDKLYENYIEFDTEQVENTKSAERQKNIFLKEKVDKWDLHKPVSNKIITTSNNA